MAVASPCTGTARPPTGGCARACAPARPSPTPAQPVVTSSPASISRSARVPTRSTRIAGWPIEMPWHDADEGTRALMRSPSLAILPSLIRVRLQKMPRSYRVPLALAVGDLIGSSITLPPGDLADKAATPTAETLHFNDRQEQRR